MWRNNYKRKMENWSKKKDNYYQLFKKCKRLLSKTVVIVKIFILKSSNWKRQNISFKGALLRLIKNIKERLLTWLWSLMAVRMRKIYSYLNHKSSSKSWMNINQSYSNSSFNYRQKASLHYWRTLSVRILRKGTFKLLANR